MSMRYRGSLLSITLLIGAAALLPATPLSANGGTTPAPPTVSATPREEPFVLREFRPYIGEQWIGNAISYGPHRDGQFPGGPSPSEAELREDLHLIAEFWNLLRLYGSGGPAETILEIIEKDDLDLRVMLGAWIGAEERRDEEGRVVEEFPEMRAGNQAEVRNAVRLAAAFPEIVLALNVGNETQVFWSAHRAPPDLLISYIREVRAGTTVPVTTADDYNFWNKPESRVVASEVDFLVMHAHPLWNGLQLEEAVDWTRKQYSEIQALHPDHLVVLGETGWATGKHNEGEQAELIKGQPGEPQQKVFFDGITRWAADKRVTLFFFEAFDENWKGGDHPDEVEKHWGLFRADRTPKQAMVGSR